MTMTSLSDSWDAWLPMDDTSLTDAAVRYAEHGRLRPITVYGLNADGSCQCGSAECAKPGKHPVGAAWQKRASADADTVRDARRGKRDAANVGLAAGPCPLGYLVIIDVDGEAGEESVQALEARVGSLPTTLASRTGRGWHLFFLLRDGMDPKRLRNRNGSVGAGVDVKVNGGQVVVAPSRHVSGERYRWVSRCAPAELPAAWYEALAVPQRAPDVSGGKPTPRLGAGAYAGDSYVRAAIEKTADRIARAPTGQRNGTLNEETFNLARLVAGRGWEGADVRDLLVSAGRAAGLSESEAADVVRRAWSAGASQPKAVPDAAGSGPRLQLVRGGGSDDDAGGGGGGGGGSGDGGSDGGGGPGSAPSWRARLQTNKRGGLEVCSANLNTILANDPFWAGKIRWDEFSERVTLRDPPWGPDEAGPPLPEGVAVAWTDTDDHRLQAWARREWGVEFPMTAIRGAVDAVARQRTVHPVRDYLDGLAWDGTPRLERLWVDYFGATDTAYHRAISRWLIAAVARVMEPGCKCDSMPIIEGDQGLGKSTALAILAGAWFSDTPLPIGDKDAFEQMRGTWIVEFGELDALNKTDTERVKSFISARKDTYRAAYARRAVEIPRQCVFAGTTNKDTYLKDATGARRFWPVLARAIDLDALRRDRDQLWAEAVVRYRDGARWWLDERGLLGEAAEAQSDRFQADPWESVLAEWAARSLDHWVPSTALSTTLGIEPQRVDRTIEMRVATCMKRLGWTRERVMHNRVRQWGWRRPTPKSEAAVGQEVGQPIVEQSRQAALPTFPVPLSPKGEGGEDRNRGGVTYPPARKNSLEVLGGGWGEGQEGQRGSKPAESHAEPLPDPAAPLPHAAPMREPGDDSDLIDGDGEEGER